MEEEKNNQETVEKEKHRRYQANFNRRHRAARKRLGLTIKEFNKLPKARRMLEMKGKPDAKARNRARQHAWYLRNKAKKVVATAPSNSESNSSDKNRIISFCRDLLAFAEGLK